MGMENEFLVPSTKNTGFYLVNSVLEPAPQDQEFSSSSSSFNNNIDKIIEQREPSGKDEEIDISTFTAFLDDVKTDYQNGGKTLCTALDKFKDRYNTAKSKSIPRLFSFLYDINRNIDLMIHVKGGANIWVQVESIKRRKMEEGGVKQRLPIPTNEGKENLDPHAIPAQKKRKTSKKEHNLSKNILKN
ncbi:hypothetical protein C1646_666701 [Rhizophagus diaphanus]|nr:hypothetical protein C1646_666701 [Rhizophagus diaphanus] [Rhizophagus sp. MUCL 43196]